MSTHYEDVYVVKIAIPMEDDLVHTSAHPFCSDPACPCHDDYGAGQQLDQQYTDGLLTSDEARRIFWGGQL